MSAKMTAQERPQLIRIQNTINAAIDRAVDDLWKNKAPSNADLIIIEHSGTVLAGILKDLGERA